MKKKRSSTNETFSGFIHLAQSSQPTKHIEKEVAFRYKCYSELLQKRSVLHEEIKKSLVLKVQPFAFNNWWRLTTSKYSMNPISASGSHKNPIGGRFNIGQIHLANTGQFLSFPALYLAETKNIVIQEVYPETQNSTQLSSQERMLSSTNADAFFKVRGQVHILDIDKPNNLTSFVKIIKK